jgi:hypothetical protein
VRKHEHNQRVEFPDQINRIVEDAFQIQGHNQSGLAAGNVLTREQIVMLNELNIRLEALKTRFPGADH